jgi:hypothetical protein
MSKAPFPIVDKALEERFEEYRLGRPSAASSREHVESYVRDVEAIYSRYGWTEDDYNVEYLARRGNAEDPWELVQAEPDLSDLDHVQGCINVLKATLEFGRAHGRDHVAYYQGYEDALKGVEKFLASLRQE